MKAAEACAAERQRKEAEKRAAEQKRREREAAKEREKYLALIAGREPELWSRVDAWVATKQPARYDEAIKLLLDLRDLDIRNKTGTFQSRLRTIRQTHFKKPSFLARLLKAGL